MNNVTPRRRTRPGGGGRERILCLKDGTLIWQEDPAPVPPATLSMAIDGEDHLFIYETTYVEEDEHGRAVSVAWYYEWEGD